MRESLDSLRDERLIGRKVLAVRRRGRYLTAELTGILNAEAVIKGDAKSMSIAAASVLAKVARDRYMIELDAKYPMYGFARNKGYGTQMLNYIKRGPDTVTPIGDLPLWLSALLRSRGCFFCNGFPLRGSWNRK